MSLLHGMLPLERRGALLFLPMEDVALVMTEYGGRVTVVSSSGETAWRPGPAGEVAGGFLAEILPGVFAHPRHASRRKAGNRGRPPRGGGGGALEFPGGWVFPDVPPFDEPAPPAPPADPEMTVRSVAGPCTVRASSVVYVERRNRRAVLKAAGRTITLAGRPAGLVAAHPHLVRIGLFHVNVRRLREIRQDARSFRFSFDTGDTLAVSASGAAAAARALGLPSLRSLEARKGAMQTLYDEGLRDWPAPILDMPTELLEPVLGGHRRMTIVNVLWQVVRLRSAGTPPDYGTDHRGFWYLPLFPVLNRLGLLQPAGGPAREGRAVTEAPGLDGPLLGAGPDEAIPGSLPASVPPALPLFGAPSLALQLHRTLQALTSSKVAAYAEYQERLADLVGRDRLFRFTDLGFEDPRPDLRTLGAAHPHVVLVVEKLSLLHIAREAARRFGISCITLGGQPSLIAVEFFAEALRPALACGRRVRVAAYVDFDPSGWLIADTFIGHLARYGVETESVCRLVLPKRFTAAEIKAVAYPLATAGSSGTLTRRWLRLSGGVGRRALGIHADHLRPLERVLAALREETGLKEVSP